MPPQTKVKCYLCGKNGLPTEMSVMGSPALGSQVDFALSVTWLCPDPCFDKARNSPRISGRIYSGHDHKYDENKANLQAALRDAKANRPDPASQPDGLRVSGDDIERLDALDGDFSVENLQDEETLAAAFRLVRNHQQLPYYHSANGTGEIWDFAELKTRLENLERLNHG
jgi:hypothetical protein